jgi:serine/threonine-protein kinase OSR1/STK39
MTASAPFPLHRSSYQFLKAIGSGATSDVFAARCLTNGQMVAIKVIDMENNPTEIENLRAEVAFWSACDHPNVVRYFGSFTEGSTLYILMEYMEGGSCFEILRSAFRKGIENEIVIATILAEVLKALAYFHEHRRLHRDVKPGNILVNEKGEVKIADFGIAASLLEQGQRKRARYTVIGTPCYMAPEVLARNHGYTEKADIWSLGISAIELSTGSAPYSNLYPLEVVVRISNSPPPQLPEDRSHLFREFVKQCLNTQPAKRATAVELLEMKFLKQKVSNHDLAAALLGGLPPFEERFQDVEPRFAEVKAGPNPAMMWDFGLPEPDPPVVTPTAAAEGANVAPAPARRIQRSLSNSAAPLVQPVAPGKPPAQAAAPVAPSPAQGASRGAVKKPPEQIQTLAPSIPEVPKQNADAAVVKRVGRFKITASSGAAPSPSPHAVPQPSPPPSPPVIDPEAARVEELQAQIEALRERLEELRVENAWLREKAVTMAHEVRALVNRQ